MSGGEASETPNPTNVGGQAVMEGVMMRAPGSISIVVRRRDKSLIVRERTVLTPSSALVKLPFVRGMYTLFSSLKLGHQALRWSAEIFEEDWEAEEAEKEGKTTKSAKKGSGALSTLALWTAQLATMSGDEQPGQLGGEDKKKGGGIAMLIPIVFAIGLFVFLPQAAAEGIDRIFGLGLRPTAPLYQVITGASKLVIIVSYLSLLRLIPDVRRVFQYHGAEHKSISTYEMGKELVVDNARPTTALHARCGTTFIIMVAFVSVVVFAIVGSFLPPLGSRALEFFAFLFIKLPFLPVVAGITYELQRFFARYCSTGPLQFLLWPGFLVQKITTAPPDDDQLEVALASLRSALANAKVTLPADHPDKAFPSYDVLVADGPYRAPT
jgi:uncharacterized protein YqhQ